MQRKYKVGLIIIIILIIGVSVFGISKSFIPKKEEMKPNTSNVVENIAKFGYTLDDRDSDYMKEEFTNLTTILKQDPIDYESYAQSLAKLFVIDFYTLNNKINKYDVGSLEYILSSKKKEFEAKAQDTIYYNLIDNTYLTRVQELPEITNVEILSCDQTTITLNEQETEAYKITMAYTYQKDLGYDQKGTIYLVKNADKLEVAIYNPSVEENN